MHKTLFLSLLSLTLFWGCTKKKKDTSPYTSSEYFTCLINGQEWVAQTPNNPNGPAAISADYSVEYDQLDIFAIQKDQNAYPSIYQKIFLRILHASSDSAEVLIGNGNLYGFANLLDAPCGVYYYDSLYPVDCTITGWEVDNHMVKGTFNLKLRNEDCIDSILTITDGQFSTYF